MRRSTYDKYPIMHVSGCTDAVELGWDEICVELTRNLDEKAGSVLTVDCYTGVFDDAVAQALVERMRPDVVVRTSELMLTEPEIDALVAPFNGGDDPIFGYLSNLALQDFFDPERVISCRRRIAESSGRVLIVGVGAALVTRGDVLVLADLARWEAQARMRRGDADNLGTANRGLKWSLQYKRAFFTDWRVCDRHKKPLLDTMDYLLDTNKAAEPKLVAGEALREGLSQAAHRPLRVVPFFDPAPWGGQWMKRVCGLDPEPGNYGWCFDCVPEENSLLLGFGDIRVEIPSLDLVYQHPRELLGDAVQARFGDEFPIRFDFLDTMDGGNLSFQVHPNTGYIQEKFGMHYTQDESYYLLDAGPDATVYLGVLTGIDPAEMGERLWAAQRGESTFPAEDFANRWPAAKHDHFLIPAGTVHCSGANSMVLEISATPYIFTFKMWDWERLGLDGLPRPINIDHAMASIAFDRDTEWTGRELVNHVELVAEGDGWREERTGLHDREFIETRRHWFTRSVNHDTDGTVDVLNLVEGAEVTVESPTRVFDPFVVHYAETFIVPAAVGAYAIRPSGPAQGTECATIKAFVRCHP